MEKTLTVSLSVLVFLGAFSDSFADERRETVLRILTCSLATLSVIAGVYSYNSYDQSKEKLDDLSTDNSSALYIGSSKQWNEARNDSKKYKALTIACGAGALIGVTGFVLTFTF